MSTATPPAFDQFSPIDAPVTKWPKVVGIIGIVLGGLAILGGVCGVIGSAATGWLGKLAEGQPAPPGGGPSPADALKAMAKHQGLVITLSLIAIPVAIFLIYGSIRLLRRRPAAHKPLLIWSAVKVVEVVFGTWVGFLMAKEQMLLAKQQAAVAGSTEFAALLSTIQLGLGVLFGLALPVFLVIWLSRQKIRDEMASWQ